jgi:uncharacterized protein (DUF433 family)
MLDWSQCVAVERNPDKVSGAWVFRGTRVPVRALFENLEGGARVEEFLEWFPGVTREQVLAVLRYAEETLAEPVAWLGRLTRLRCGFSSTRVRPVPLRCFFSGHEVSTAYAEGWARFGNGDLLAAAEGRFDIFITTDKNLRYQQDLRGRTLAIVVLPTTSWPEIQPHGTEIAELASGMTPGDYREIDWWQRRVPGLGRDGVLAARDNAGTLLTDLTRRKLQINSNREVTLGLVCFWFFSSSNSTLTMTT